MGLILHKQLSLLINLFTGLNPAEQLTHYDPSKAPASPTASDSSRTSGFDQKHNSPRSSRHSGSPESGRHQRAPPSPTSSQGSSTAAAEAPRLSGPSPGQHDVWEKQSPQQRASSPPRHSGTAPPSSTTPNPFRTSASVSSPTAAIQRPDYPPTRAPSTPGNSNPFASANNPFMEPGNPFTATQQISASATHPAQISPSSRLSDQTGQQMRADPNRPPAGPAPVLHRPGISPPYPPVAHEQQQQTPGSRDYSDRRSPGQGSVDSWRSTSTTGLFYETALFSLRILLYQS